MANMKLILSPKGVEGSKKTTILSARVTEETMLRVNDICKKTGRSRTDVVRLLLDYALANVEIGDK